MTKLRWTLATIAALGGSAAADGLSANTPSADSAGETIMVSGSSASSRRGVAEDYLVMPEGGELTGQMKFVMADPVLAGQPLKFTDLGLFGLSGRWSLFSKLEASASVDFLAKQPSYTDEKPWQSVGFALRSPLARNVALTLSGGGGHLLDHTGEWTREGITVEWKKAICCKYDGDLVAFDIAGGVDGLGLATSSDHMSAFLTEVGTQLSTLVREPTGHWGAWLGIGYAVPVEHSGSDPTTGLAIDPQPRLDFHLGTVVSVEHRWDLFVDLAVIDRGDLQNPATRLPILDGGFDQKQIIFGVTRHIDPPAHKKALANDAYQLSSAE